MTKVYGCGVAVPFDQLGLNSALFPGSSIAFAITLPSSSCHANLVTTLFSIVLLGHQRLAPSLPSLVGFIGLRQARRHSTHCVAMADAAYAAGQPDASRSPPRTVEVKVLSQLSGPDGTLILPSLPVTTSIAALKTLISQSLASKPPPDRQRLIHRGRVMAREADTLEDVFGSDNVRQSSTHSLHLVVRDNAMSSAPAGAPALPQSHPRQPRLSNATHLPPHLFQGQPVIGTMGPPLVAASPQPAAHQPSATANTASLFNPQLVAPSAPSPRSSPGQPTPRPGTPAAAAHPANGGVLFPPQLPGMHSMVPQIPQFQNLMQQHMAALGRQGLPVPQFHHHLHQQRHAAALADDMAQEASHDMHSHDPTVPLNHAQGNNNNDVNNNTAGAASAPTVAGNAGGQTATTREAVAPNVERWTFTMNATLPGAPPPQVGLWPGAPPQFATALPGQFVAGFGRMPPPLGFHLRAGGQGVPPPVPQPDISRFGPEYAQHAQMAMRRYWDDLGVLEARRGDFSAPDFQTQLHNLVRLRNREQENLNYVLQCRNRGEAPNVHITHDDVQALRTLNNDFSARITALTNDSRGAAGDASVARENSSSAGIPHVDTPNATNTAAPSVPAATQTPSLHAGGVTHGPSQIPHQYAHPPYAYLLHSPAGLYGLVVDSNGSQWSTRSSVPTSRSNSRNIGTPHLRPIRRVNSHLNLRSTSLRSRQQSAENETAPDAGSSNDIQENDNRNAPQHENLAEEIEHAIAHVQANQGVRPDQAQQPVPPENQGEDLVGILGPVFRHLWLLIRLAGFVWFFTAGSMNSRTFILGGVAAVIFAVQVGLFGDRWERLQQHFEGLIGPLAPIPGHGQEAGANAHGANGNDGIPNQAAAAGAPNPRATAERLIRERAQQDRGWFMNRAVAIERALALFIASLYPGVGERHVAERERARLEAEAQEVARAQVAAAAQEVNMANNSNAAPIRGENNSASAGLDRTTSKPEEDAQGRQGDHDEARGSTSAVQPSEGTVTERRAAVNDRDDI